MPRTLWTGSLSFGLVNIPIALLPATRDRDVRLREIDRRNGVPVEVRRICTLEDTEVPLEELARGVEVDGEVVMLTDEELAGLQPERTETIEITRFVELSQIDPAMYDHPYWVAPSGKAQGPLRAYRLLVDALAASGRGATGQTVIHNREHPVVIRAREGRLMMHTLLFEHEVRDVADLEIPEVQASQESVAGAVAVIQELTTDFDASHYHDRHRRRLEALVEKKAAGERITQPAEPPQPAAAPDLLGALEQSLAEIRATQSGQSRSRRRQEPAQKRPPGSGRSPRKAPPTPRTSRTRRGPAE